MPGKIYIVHASEVVRKGFQAVLRTFCTREIVLLENTETLKTIPPETHAHSVFLVQALYAQKLSNYHMLIIEDEEPISLQANQISIYTSTSVLKEKIEIFNTTAQLAYSKKSDHESLTERETDVLKLVAYGHSNKEIADKLFISIHTVISHRKNITEKLSIKSISGLTVYAILNHLIDTDSIDSSTLI